CLDMVNFWAPETIPQKFSDRRFYQHNPNITLMRTTPDECRRLGEILAGKLNGSCGPVTVLLPLKGLSVIDAPDGPFWWPEAGQALVDALKKSRRPERPVVEIDANVKDEGVARQCAAALLEHMAAG